MHIEQATDQRTWDDFLLSQTFRPFLQSWTMGEVYRDCGQEPIRIIAKEGDQIVGICQAIVVSARRGRHVAVQYGPITSHESRVTSHELFKTLCDLARQHSCSFIRVSPFVPLEDTQSWSDVIGVRSTPSPMHLLAEHLWYLPLVDPDRWKNNTHNPAATIPESSLLMGMRKTTRNLIRRAEKDGVTVRASADPSLDIEHFLRLHNETKARHGFTPYRDSFFRAQVRRFSERGECTLYLAEHQGQVLASSIHMHVGGETSYHHGASSMSKVPASYLLQWKAITDALARGDHVYNFWGIAPVRRMGNGEWKMENAGHPFAGVTLFKTGFGGTLLNLMHCRDIPLSPLYRLTRAFEQVRKWKRGF